MKKKRITVIYYSETGNTKKVAQAIASALKCKAISIENIKNIKKYNTIFIGSPVYMWNPAPEVKKFIRKSSLKNKKIAVFCTFGLWHGTSLYIMQRICEKKGAKVIGKFGTIAKSHGIFFPSRPNKNDLAKAREFAKNIMKLIT